MSRATIWFGVVTLATCALVWFAAVSRLADHATAERVARSATRIQNPSAVAPALPESDAMTPQHGPSCGPFDAADRSRQLNNLKPARPDVACELRARSSRLRRGFLPFLPPWNTPKRNGDRRVTRTYAEEAGR